MIRDLRMMSFDKSWYVMFECESISSLTYEPTLEHQNTGTGYNTDTFHVSSVGLDDHQRNFVES